MRIFSIIIFILFLSSTQLKALSFPDNNGVIEVKEDNMVIRLIEQENSDIKIAEALFSVEAAPEKCFKVISNILDYPNFMPDIEEAKLVRKTAKGKEYDFVYDAPLWDVEYTLLMKDSVINGIYTINWTYIKGDLNDNKGHWIIREFVDSTRTQIRYSISLDPGTILPDWLVSKLTAGSIPDMVEAIRERVKR